MILPGHAIRFLFDGLSATGGLVKGEMPIDIKVDILRFAIESTNLVFSDE
ncbi:MAG: hypothetical protein ACKO5E_03545 [bacterium]